jgi:hypothetical protein
MHGGLRGTQGTAMTGQERRHLAQADWHIAECKTHIACQQKLIREIAQHVLSTEMSRQSTWT